jgi:hypothetical protein
MEETVGNTGDQPYRFYDVPKEAYPIDIEFVAQRTGEVVHVIHVDGPGVLHVPNLAKEHGPIDVWMTYRGLNETYHCSPQL